MFPTEYAKILAKLDAIDPVRYGSSRNYINGAVTKLSPYISRGVLSTRKVLDHVLAKGHKPNVIEKFIQELAWRDYWQQVWKWRGDEINKDLKQQQKGVWHHGIPKAIIDAFTGIEGIDEGIRQLYDTGYMHNHVRMYTAFLACNAGGSHWKMPAQWMYYHLLDADWASNALSWQWVAGTNASKKYIANQENINRYTRTRQQGTYLDLPYEEIALMPLPPALAKTSEPLLLTTIPENRSINIDPAKPTLVYNFYNLDPEWKKGIDANRILLLEPGIFRQYPVSEKTIAFVLALAKNIGQIQVYTGSFGELEAMSGRSKLFFREHPLNSHYRGNEESRDWMFPVNGDYPSFFAFWKKCSKHL